VSVTFIKYSAEKAAIQKEKLFRFSAREACDSIKPSPKGLGSDE